MLKKVEAVFSGMSSVAVGLLMVLVTLQVVTRYFFSPVAGTVEVAQALMVMVVYLGLAGAFRERQHIGVDFVVTRLTSDKFRVIMRVAGLLLSFIVGVLWTWHAAKAAHVAWVIGDTTGGLRPVPLWPSKLVIALGSGLLSTRIALELYLIYSRLLMGEVPPPPDSADPGS